MDLISIAICGKKNIFGDDCNSRLDEMKSVPLLGGHLSPKSRLFDQILS